MKVDSVEETMKTLRENITARVRMVAPANPQVVVNEYLLSVLASLLVRVNKLEQAKHVQPDPSGFLPIEFAPMDGTTIAMRCRNKHGIECLVTARWDDGLDVWLIRMPYGLEQPLSPALAPVSFCLK